MKGWMAAFVAAGRREGLRIGPAVLVGEVATPLIEGFARLDPHYAHPREVGYTVQALLESTGRPVSVALRLVEYVDSADPDHPGRVDERLAAAGVAERCELRPGDYHTVALEDESFDLVVLGHICRTEGADGTRALLGRATAALRPGGRVLVSDYFRAEDPSRSPQGVFMAATMAACTARGTAFTYEQMSSWLREAGLAEIRLIEPIAAQQIFVATKPATTRQPTE